MHKFYAFRIRAVVFLRTGQSRGFAGAKSQFFHLNGLKCEGLGFKGDVFPR